MYSVIFNMWKVKKNLLSAVTYKFLHIIHTIIDPIAVFVSSVELGFHKHSLYYYRKLYNTHFVCDVLLLILFLFQFFLVCL